MKEIEPDINPTDNSRLLLRWLTKNWQFIIMICGFLGLGSYETWERFHDRYLEKKFKQAEHSEYLERLIDERVIQTLEADHRLLDDRLEIIEDSVHAVFKYAKSIDQNETENWTRTKALERFNERYGYKFEDYQ